MFVTRSIAFLLDDDEGKYSQYRELAATEMRKRRAEMTEVLFDGNASAFDEYVDRTVLAEGVWAGGVELEALARALHRDIFVFHAGGDQPYCFSSGAADSGGCLVLAHVYGNHYDPVQPE